ncbi:hypothetical protein Q8W25_17645 [Shimia thalassica]|uniref:hypothetical protein n=1 Tax=Shimia thalassica TaxID=1715693 RepID=UPI0027367739|nr:hypothetical protein [Shimia thalassica]MDP2495856.1 hypothetical protein [Shimia thalassica]
MSGTDLERLNIILAARDREFTRALDRNIRKIERFERHSNKKMSKASKHFDMMAFAAKRVLPALVALASVDAVGRVVSDLDDIGKTADKIGLTTDALQELRTIAESAGVAQSSLDSSMERFSKRLGEAVLGTGAANKALKEMGLSADDLVSMGLDDALSVVADEIAKIPDPTERTARAAALFGREGVAMVNLLREGADGMAQMRAEARDLGIVIDEDLIRGAEDAQTELDLMGRVIKANLSAALVELAPLLVAGAQGAASMARAIAGVANIVSDFVDPSTDLEIATSNVVLAMNDEILASQALERQLVNDVNMSVKAAEQKLKEAKARHENARAAMAEARAMGADKIAEKQIRLGELESKNPKGRNDTSRVVKKEIERLKAELDSISDNPVYRELEQQSERAERNIAILTDAIANQVNGYVSLGGQLAKTVKLGDRVSKGAARTKEKFAAILPEGENYASLLARIQQLYDSGAISGDQYQTMIDKLEDKFKGVREAAKSIDETFAQTASGIIRNSSTAGDAIGRLLDRMADTWLQQGLTSLFGSLGIGDALSGIFQTGFASGGYTGAGGVNEPAGIVHKGEYVMPASAVKRIGVGNLAAIQQGKMPTQAATASAQSLSVSIGFDDSTGGFTAFVRDQAGNVVAQASKGIMQGAVKASQRQMQRSKGMGGL